MSTSQTRIVGWTLLGIGLIGIVTGVVPFAANAIRIIAREDLLKAADLIAHGVEAMGLSIEWAMLSSAMGTFLGSLMVWAGVGWIRGRRWAPLVTWLYVFCALTVNVTDTIIFAFRAKPGPMRSLFLAADGVALLIPVIVAVWLMRKGFRVSSSGFPASSSGFPVSSSGESGPSPKSPAQSA